MKAFWKSRRFPYFVLLVDAAVIGLLWLGAHRLRALLNPIFPRPINPVDSYYQSLPLLVILFLVVTAYHGLYRFRERGSGFAQLRAVIKSWFVGLVGMLALATVLKHLELGRSVIFFASVFIAVYYHLSRTLIRMVKNHLLKKGIGLTPTLIVGAGEGGCKLHQKINHSSYGFLPLGFVDDDPGKQGTIVRGVPVVGTTAQLKELIEKQGIEEVFFAIPSMPHSQLLNLLVSCEGTKAEFNLVSDLLDVITSQVKIDELEEIPIIKIKNGHLTPAQEGIKRVMDLAIAMGLLTLLLLPALLLALLIRLDSPGSVIFRQERVGKDGRHFTLYKFRTMHKETPPYQEAPGSPDDPRITRFGRFLRRTSLDEIPQLLNVIKGDMSMVGPRPEMPFIVARYEEWQRRRLNVKPGITGLWQVAGRKRLPLALHLEYDFYYIKNQSLLLDFIILLKTIPSVFLGKGAF